MANASGSYVSPTWIYLLMLVMLISGAANTLLMKLQVRTHVPTGPGEEATGFSHPVTQSFFMAVGECLCLGAFYGKLAIDGKTEVPNAFPKSIMIIPAICDLTASTLIHAAYVFIPASIAQMTRGSIVIFTCLASVFFLGRRQYAFHYTAVVLVATGIAIVAMAAIFFPHGEQRSEPSRSATLGVSLCLVAQIFHAAMLVVEEKFLRNYTIPPLQAVGLEGAFGIGIITVALAILNPLGFENTPGAVYQLGHSAVLLVAVICSVLSIALFNWSGISITAHSSCVARATIDGARTILIWAVELLLLWNVFHPLQLIGFIVLAMGTLLYNRIVEFRTIFYYPEDEEEKPLVQKGQDVGDLEAKPVVLTTKPMETQK
mmetsp:Transcript_31792/g.72845  ORF Transcript_31792/g.72845 Transcript_31792/m.72845 type:complete len:374 (+) Transcript_31792:120-1241(+)